MRNGNKHEELPQFIKIVYFDDDAAQYYLDISNGCHEERKNEKRIQKSVNGSVDIEAHAKAGFNLLEIVKSAIDGKASTAIDAEVTRVVRTILTSTLLTEFLSACDGDDAIIKIEGDGVYAPQSSAVMYKMISNYLTVVSMNDNPIDMDKLNQAVLSERGYYGLLLRSEKNKPKRLLRFNVDAFKNQYQFVDLSKMVLTFYGVKVGECNIGQLSIDNELTLTVSDGEREPNREDLPSGGKMSDGELSDLEVIDIILAGVVR